MSRLVNTNTPLKRRNQSMRAIAELLRHLAQKPAVDEQSKDMLAAIVFALREIEKTLDEVTEAWEKRDYWVKAEKFREEWVWSGISLDALTDVLKKEDWARLPTEILRLMPHVASITINKFTHGEDLWQGKYKQLRAEFD
jgi:predicted RNase H-like nuclease (RuvC/YqgF family)